MNSSYPKHSFLKLLNELENALHCSQALPKAQHLQLLRITSPQIKQTSDHITSNVLSEFSSLASRYSVSLPSSDTDSHSSHSSTALPPADSIFDHTIETTDEALQHFNTALDAANNIKNAVVPSQLPIHPTSSTLNVAVPIISRRHGTFLDIEKPQIHFHDCPIDNSDTPFVSPYSHFSPNTTSNQHIASHVQTHLQELYKNNSHPETNHPHPYQHQIAAAVKSMAPKTFTHHRTVVYKSFEQTPCTFITTRYALQQLAITLQPVSTIAVDIENHSIRSFQGFVCLIQISTRNEDFVIDALKLRQFIHQALAPVFADPNVIKVLHGADKDVQWLERDFGIYVVNMFDTGQAARILKLPSASLAFAQTYFCDVNAANKRKFQLADWRQRPLPKEMFQYARSDTHYLLYIYDRLRSELSKKSLLEKAWHRSAVVSKKRHKKIRFNPGMPKHLAARHGLSFDDHQMRLFEELCRWRDATARKEDESLAYVSSVTIIFGIVRARDKARTVEGLLKYGFPAGIIPPLMYKNADKLAQLIGDALDAKLEKAVEKDNSPREVSATSDQEQDYSSDENMECKETEEAENQMAVSFELDGEALQSDRKQPLPHTGEIQTKLATKLSVSMKLRSCLFDSDSGCSDDDESDKGTTPPALESHIYSGRESQKAEAAGEKEEGTVDAHTLVSNHIENEEGRSPSRGATQQVRVVEDTQAFGVSNNVRAALTAKHSVLHPYSSSEKEVEVEEEESSKEQRLRDEKVARVKAAIESENRSSAQIGNFALETDVKEVEEKAITGVLESGVAGINGENVKEQEHEVVSLLESARRVAGPRSSKRRKKSKSKLVREEAKVIAPFNYQKAVSEQKQQNGSSAPAPFDPMHDLRKNWKLGSRRGVRKRRAVRVKESAHIHRNGSGRILRLGACTEMATGVAQFVC